MDADDNKTFDYRRRSRHPRVFAWVVTCHVLFLGLLFVYFVLDGWFKKKPPQTISVNLGSIPAAAASQKGSPDAVPPPEKPKPEEPEPEPEPPKPEPPKPEPPKPKPKPEKEKAPAPKEEPKEKPKEEPKEPPKKEEKWTPLDPTQIKRNPGKVITKKAPKPSPTFTPLPVRTVPLTKLPGPPGDIGDMLAESLKGIPKPGNPFKGGLHGGFSGAANGDGGALAMGYLDKVQAILYKRWRQPNRSALGGRNPVVTVRISVDASGKVSGATIIRSSGISPMDMSVKDLLDRLYSLPPPPPGLGPFEVELEAVE